ncbi:LytR C-terminal domain-containing protein [Microbacterium hominis]|uniref:LytR C-terminal domain-containing protein n=1 Tax=Microbacterium hominis TaxID=162426 RepID=A0A7D4UFW2_9MICO|nr:LytR C-terminal domain-containing protein [Microbacterium hominis]QKJ18829.1 LytR C-terminal domain-containing protein [Microbacterium hominis]
MPHPSYPKDRFDDLPSDTGRVGAHRAENPHIHRWVVLMWAVGATIVLIALGVFATLLASGRVTLFPTSAPVVEASPTATVVPVLDTTYEVLVLNATPQSGLATQTKDAVVNAGWPADDVLASEAGTDDFPETTVYYATEADQAAAAGLAEAIGGARIEQSSVYQPADDPEARQLTVVVGLDRTDAPAAQTPES